MTSIHVLVLYLSTVLAAIAPHLGQNRRDSITSDIATVVLSEERAFDDDANGQKNGPDARRYRALRDGEVLGRLVDDGRCNDLEWRAMHAEWLRGGGCDHALAWGLFQVHPPGDDARIGKLYVTNRRVGISAALFIARKSLQAGIGLCGYSGEPYPNCRKRTIGSMRLARGPSSIRLPFLPRSRSPRNSNRWGREGHRPRKGSVPFLVEATGASRVAGASNAIQSVASTVLPWLATSSRWSPPASNGSQPWRASRCVGGADCAA